MRNPTIRICSNIGAGQLRSNCKADQRFCFHYTDSTIPLLSKSKISSLLPSSVLVQFVLCQTCSETTLLVFSRGSLFLLSVMPNVAQQPSPQPSQQPSPLGQQQASPQPQVFPSNQPQNKSQKMAQQTPQLPKPQPLQGQQPGQPLPGQLQVN